MHFDGHLHAVLQIGDAILADPVLLQFDLLVVDVVHEDQGVALFVQIGEFLLFEGDAFDLVFRAEAFVQLVAGLEVLGLDVGEGAALAGLDVGGLGYDPQAAVHLQDHAGLDGVAVDFHRCLGRDWAQPATARERAQSVEDAVPSGKAAVVQ